MLGRDYRPSVLIKTQEREIEVIAGKVEIVGIAAEEGGGKFDREHQPHVGIFAVGVEFVLAAVVERDDLAAIYRIAALTSIFFDRGNDAVSRAQILRTVLLLGRVIHVRRDVADRRKNFRL